MARTRRAWKTRKRPYKGRNGRERGRRDGDKRQNTERRESNNIHYITYLARRKPKTQEGKNTTQYQHLSQTSWIERAQKKELPITRSSATRVAGATLERYIGLCDLQSEKHTIAHTRLINTLRPTNAPANQTHKDMRNTKY